jgi:flavin-dependent dehydrogenase
MHVQANGYTGIAPLPGDVANVCVVREWSNVGRGGTRGESVIEEAIRRQPRLAERFSTARQVSPVMSLGPLAVDARAAGISGLLLAGDAAGFIDPMTGDGLRFAIRGGELAAEAALRELNSGTAAYASLAAARRREFGGKWRLNRTLRWLTSSPARLRLAAAVAERWSTPFESLIRIAGDCPAFEPLPDVR